MTEAEFERRIGGGQGASADPEPDDDGPTAEPEPSSRASTSSTRARSTRAKASKPKRVQRMFAIEEDVDKKLWLYAIHMGKDRSEVVNDLLRPIVASMVLYDSRDRRGSRNSNSSLAVDRDSDSEEEAA
jgi:hypothetical protein